MLINFILCGEELNNEKFKCSNHLGLNGGCQGLREENEEAVFSGYRVWLGKMEALEAGQWRWLHSMNVNATELDS